MRKLPLLFVVLAGLMAAAPLSAATKELTQTVFAQIPWDEDKPSFETRRRFALAIYQYWENFKSRVPRLSPKEQEWIEEEMAAQGDRVSRALNSKEYALWSLSLHTDLCLNAISNVIGSFETEQSRQVEMFYWTRMINCYDGTNDLIYYLDRAGIPYNDSEGQNIQIPLSNITQRIIVNKVIPMAMSETMGWSFEN